MAKDKKCPNGNEKSIHDGRGYCHTSANRTAAVRERYWLTLISSEIRMIETLRKLLPGRNVLQVSRTIKRLRTHVLVEANSSQIWVLLDIAWPGGDSLKKRSKALTVAVRLDAFGRRKRLPHH